VTFSKEAREEFLQFALSPGALWSGNFRDLNAAVARMATLAQGARISVDLVREEIARLQASWPLHNSSGTDPLSGLLSPDHLSQLDLFDRLQLERVLDVCRHSRSLSDAGRTLFHASRSRKTTSNDADRLRKYLSRFGLEWAQLSQV
jgi:transcriptional regulatory protein RtcR